MDNGSRKLWRIRDTVPYVRPGPPLGSVMCITSSMGSSAALSRLAETGDATKKDGSVAWRSEVQNGDVRKKRRLELEEDPCGRSRHRRSDRPRGCAGRIGGRWLGWPLLTQGPGCGPRDLTLRGSRTAPTCKISTACAPLRWASEEAGQPRRLWALDLDFRMRSWRLSAAPLFAHREDGTSRSCRSLPRFPQTGGSH